MRRAAKRGRENAAMSKDRNTVGCWEGVEVMG